jgi:putative phage-type endonuclease
MITHDLLQGSSAWLAYRAQHFNASDAPAMMGCSPYKNRTQLLHEMHTGLTPEVDAGTQRRFDDGHRFEVLARPLAEKIIGEDLFPVVGSLGKFSASFDGLTMAEDTAFEHKSLNDELRGCMKDEGNGYDLPLQYQVQMEQQLMVSGAERVLFMASKWEGDTLIESRHCWYASDPAIRQKIIAGWIQFEQDMAAYQPEEAPAPAAVGHTPETLPALRIEVTGMVTASNLADYKAHALAVFAGINRELKTDQQFADADKVVKWCGDVETRLAAAKQHALSQTESIDALFRTIDDISAEARRVRLELDKLVKARKEAVRGEIVADGVTALREHIASLNQRLGKPYMPTVPADFGGAVKGKRTVASLQDAVDTELARAKIDASSIADRIQVNLTTLRELATAHAFLFADASVIVLKAPDDLTILVKSRIADHKADEAQKEADTRERIRTEERQKLEREQAEAQAAEETLITSIWANANRIEFDSMPYIKKAMVMFESGPGTFENDPRPRVAAAVAEAREQMAAKLETAQAREQAEAAKKLIGDAAAATAADATQAAMRDQIITGTGVTKMVAALDNADDAPVMLVERIPPANVFPMRAAQAPAAPPATPPTLKLGQIGERLGFSLTSDFLKTLGFEPAARDKSALLFHEANFGHICAALVDHINQVQAQQAA